MCFYKFVIYFLLISFDDDDDDDDEEQEEFERQTRHLKLKLNGNVFPSSVHLFQKAAE